MTQSLLVSPGFYNWGARGPGFKSRRPDQPYQELHRPNLHKLIRWSPTEVQTTFPSNWSPMGNIWFSMLPTNCPFWLNKIGDMGRMGSIFWAIVVWRRHF